MSHLNLELSSVLSRDMGWTLVHFLWQGVGLALLLQAILPLCRSAVARHNWALGTLATMCLAPVITFLWLHGDGLAVSASVAGFVPQHVTIAPGEFAPASASVPWTGWLVGFWLAGILLLSLRALGGLMLAQGLRQNGLELPDDLLQRCRALQRRLAVPLPVRFLQSRHVTAPMVVGWLKPVILIPVSAIVGLAPQQLDALILHELAHIRRLDAFSNVILLLAENVLFYHPAVWWVTRRVRIEREHCCDDVAVTHCGSAAIYVGALASLETNRAMPVLALAADGGSLKDRAARLLGASSDRSRFSLSAIAGLAFLSLVVGTVATAKINAPAQHQDFAIRVVDETGTPDQSCDSSLGTFESVDLAMGPNGNAVWNGKSLDQRTFDQWLANVAKLNRSGRTIYFRVMAWENTNTQKLVAVVKKYDQRIIPICEPKSSQQAWSSKNLILLPVATFGPLDEPVHVRTGVGLPSKNTLWLKREGGISGNVLADARVDVQQGKPVIVFRLTPEAAKQFGALTKENVGHRLAVVVNGTVLTAPTVQSPILGGKGQLTGNFTTEAEANTLVAEMMGTTRPTRP